MRLALVSLILVLTANAQQGANTNSNQYSLSLNSDWFLTPWESFDQQRFQAEFGHQLELDHFQSNITFAGDMASEIELTGNIHKLLGVWSFQGGTFSLGRQQPVDHALLYVGAKQRLNHRICVNPFRCYQGGPIGFHFEKNQWSVSLIAITLPSLSPRTGLGADFSLQTKNRWADVPVQQVEILDQNLDLKNAVELEDPWSPLFSPGLRLGHKTQFQNLAIDWMSQYGLSNFPNNVKSAKLGFWQEPGGQLEVVIKNTVRPQFEYEQIHNLDLNLKQSWGFWFQENTAAKVNSAPWRVTSLSGAQWGHHAGIQSGLGFIRLPESELVWALSQNKLFYRLSDWTYAINASTLHSKLGQAYLLKPEILFLASSDLTLNLNLTLIQASETTVPFYGEIRGNDFASLGMTYVL